jgi:DNA-binding beta-propeller fold protein YncE
MLATEEDRLATAGPQFEIDTNPDSVQHFRPRADSERFEGVAFSTSGDIIGAATANTNAVYLFRRKADGRFDETPYCAIKGAASRLNYPHDLSFSRSGEVELLAVALRRGSILIYRRDKDTDVFGPEPVFRIGGWRARLSYSDGVAFVPPDDQYLAAANLRRSTVTFYRRLSTSPVRFRIWPEFRLRHASLYRPDGLGLSADGEWLATANHGHNTVAIFRRGPRNADRLMFGPDPTVVIRDPSLRYPHSVVFTPETGHLVVTNAGANYFSVYAPTPDGEERQWSPAPIIQQSINSEDAFRAVNLENEMEGGPKGIAIHRQSLAVCSPQIGMKIFAIRERRATA